MNTADRLNILLIENNEDDCVIVRDLLRDVDADRFVLVWADSYAGERSSGLSVCRTTLGPAALSSKGPITK